MRHYVLLFPLVGEVSRYQYFQHGTAMGHYVLLFPLVRQLIRYQYFHLGTAMRHYVLLFILVGQVLRYQYFHHGTAMGQGQILQCMPASCYYEDVSWYSGSGDQYILLLFHLNEINEL